MDKSEEIFRIVKEFNRTLYKRQTRSEYIVKRVTFSFQIVGSVLYLTSIIFSQLNVTRDMFGDNGAIVILFLGMITLVVSVFCDLCLTISQMARSRSRQDDAFIHEMKRDSEYAQRLLVHTKTDLKKLDDWLELKISRSKKKVSGLLGKYDKFTLFFAFGSLYSTYKNLIKDQVVSHNVIMAICAGLIGFCIGVFLTKAMIDRYEYYREIIKISLKQKKKEVATKKVAA